MKNFFEHVIGKTEEILSQNSFARSERHISEVLTHIDLLERTVRLPTRTRSSNGVHCTKKAIRESLNRVDPRNTTLRWGALVSRRVYFVPWPNSL